MKPIFANKYTCETIMPLLGFAWDRKTQADDKATKALAFCPSSEADTRWSSERICAAVNYLDARREGLTREVAGKRASLLWNGMQAHPDADQLSIVRLENGATSILPTATLDLSTGFVAGGNVATALMIDVRGLRERVARAIDAAALLVGDE